MGTPKHLYHYTTVESLAMILSTKQLRLSPLTSLDDLEEAKTEDVAEIGKTIYVSSWTADENESIPLWNIYSKADSGIRIKAPSYIFEESTIDSNNQLYVSGNLFYTSKRVLFEAQLEKVFYTDSKEELFPRIEDSESGIWDMSKLGKYKNSAWEFQNEWRYIVRVHPGIEFDNGVDDINTVYNSYAAHAYEYVYMNIRNEVFDDIEVTLSPNISEGNRVILKVLKEKYCPNLTIKESSLHDKIR